MYIISGIYMYIYIYILVYLYIYIYIYIHITYIYIWRNDVIWMMDRHYGSWIPAFVEGLSAGLFGEFFSTDASYLDTDAQGFLWGHHGGTMGN